MHSLAAKNRRVLHEQRNNQSFGPMTLADRFVFSGFIGLSETDLPTVKAYRSANLDLLAVLPSNVSSQPGMVNSAILPAGRAIFFGSGNYFDRTGGGVHPTFYQTHSRLATAGAPSKIAMMRTER
jgi:hypothetical protein